MPSFKEHQEFTDLFLQALGIPNRYRYIHKWLDYPSIWSRAKHRGYAHDYLVLPFLWKWAQDAGEDPEIVTLVAALHLWLDENWKRETVQKLVEAIKFINQVRALIGDESLRSERRTRNWEEGRRSSRKGWKRR